MEKLTVFTDEGEEIEIPTKYMVCSRCDGEGEHVNPAIDEHGISMEEFDEDPDFKEDYFAGVYDVPCFTCKGKRVERVPDWENMTPQMKSAWDDHLDYEREKEQERKMGY